MPSHKFSEDLRDTKASGPEKAPLEERSSFFRHLVQQLGGKIHFQPVLSMGVRKTSHCLWAAIGKRYIRLYIVDGSTIQQICSPYQQYRPLRRIPIDPFQTDAGQSQGLGRKGERVANTPILLFPPSRGGRTVGDQP